ncbi:hypothetical protein [Paracoccus endophyticus]|uniref:hypothetical protein n=1 Tax=Paracoccus endophyticus TaxID=2233774 RepID=UPI000DDA1236|nr:hypothetical protein [Paracoccus endophyticus]
MTLDLAVDIALAAFGAVLAAFCFVLSARLRRLNDLETGLGGAIAVMTAEVNRLEAAIGGAKAEATAATRALATQIERARTERALWALHQQPPERRPLRRRRSAQAPLPQPSEAADV